MKQPTKVGQIGIDEILGGDRPDFLKTGDQFKVASTIYAMLLDPLHDPVAVLNGGANESLLRKDLSFLMGKVSPSVRMNTIRFLHASMERSYDVLIQNPRNSDLEVPPAPKTPEWMAPVENLPGDHLEVFEKEFQEKTGHFTFHAGPNGENYHFKHTLPGANVISDLKTEWKKPGPLASKLDGAVKQVGQWAKRQMHGQSKIDPDLAAKFTVLCHIENLSAHGRISPIHDYPEAKQARLASVTEQLPRDGASRIELATKLVVEELLGGIQAYGQTLADGYVAQAREAVEKLDILILASKNDRVHHGERQQSYLETMRSQTWFRESLAVLHCSSRAAAGKFDPQSALITHYPEVLAQECMVFWQEANSNPPVVALEHHPRQSINLEALRTPGELSSSGMGGRTV